MKLSEIQVDSSVIEAGDWVSGIPDLAGIRIKARGTNNDDYRLLEGKLLQEIPRNERADGLSPAEQDRITGTLLLETVVLDVDGLTEDDEITPIKYSKDIGKKLLLDRDFRVFRAGAAYAGSVVASRRKSNEVVDVKN